jgi:hypothetical protein
MTSWTAEALRRQKARLSALMSRPRLRLRLPVTAAGKAVVAAGVVVVLSAAGVPAAVAALHGQAGTAVTAVSAVGPQLTTNTPARCNAPPKPGYAQCFAIGRTPSDHRITPDAAGPPPTALGPADIQSAYNLPSATAGGGQTVAIVDVGDDAEAESDLAVFRSQYGLSACTTANGCFTKVNQDGVNLAQDPSAAPSDQGWGDEISLDLDAVSSACPLCNILLVEANSAHDTDLGASVNTAVSLGATAVSNSYGGGEDPSELQADQDYNHPGVAITASAGDSGYSVNYPSASQYVTAVGGTTLTKDSSLPRGWNETVWGDGTEGAKGDGTGSGCSAVEPQPGFQAGISQLDAVCQNRATADVSADADPQSGLGIYDTDPADDVGGWAQFGGTSLASPIIAATFALAGKPAAGTYPDTYPYHDTSQSADLNDITSGSNGDCGNVLCNAGPGWDGPTGLGTPDGVGAFQGAPQGQVSGQVTDQATGKPVAGATVTAQPGDYVTRTDASGSYDLTLAGGATYTLTAADYGYQSGNDSNVTVTTGQTTTENFTLTAAPSGTLSGTVSDGSGQGWGLHAQITIPGYPAGSVWTDPVTGRYSVTLPQGSYSLTVSTDYPGYQDKTVQVTVGSGTTTQDITLDADLTACTAPGYGPDGLTEGFGGWTGSTPRDDWTASSPGGAGWRFDDPGNRPPPARGSATIPGTGIQYFNQFDSDTFAVADAGYYTPRTLHTTLTSAPVSLARQAKPQIAFDSAYHPDGATDTAQVQLSTDGGRSWATIWHQSASSALGPISIPVPQAAGKAHVQARWTFTGSGLGYWAVGALLIGNPVCVAQTGGLITGTVTDSTSGSTVNGAAVTSAASPQPAPWPQGISLAATDPALPGGYYWLFAPAGTQHLSATATGYAPASATVTMTPGQVTQKNWALSPATGG